MLKYLKLLILLVLPFSLAMTLTSCSDDDNEVSDEETSLLVGTWFFYEDDGMEEWTFYSNGTHKWSHNSYILTGKYSYDSSTKILLTSWFDAEDDETWIEKYKVLSVSKLELVLQDEDGETITFNRKI